MTRDEIISVSKAEGGMFIVIPSVVKMDGDLPLSAQMLYGIITWKCNNCAYTWATNQELGDSLSLSQKRVSALVSKLVNHGYISREIKRDPKTNEVLERRLYPLVR